MMKIETRTAFNFGAFFAEKKFLKFVDCLSEFVELCQFYNNYFYLYNGNQRF